MLFFGDIGSGKSSILKAIEFALFGTLTHADLSGDSILRRGEIKAKVKLTFTIDGKRYSIIRGLSKNRGGKISQTTGTFIDHGASTEVKYAPTDLRRIILKLYPIPLHDMRKLKNYHSLDILFIHRKSKLKK